MELNKAQEIQKLMNKRDSLYSQYSRTCFDRYINKLEHGEEVFKEVNLALLKAINKIDEELTNYN